MRSLMLSHQTDFFAIVIGESSRYFEGIRKKGIMGLMGREDFILAG